MDIKVIRNIDASEKDRIEGYSFIINDKYIMNEYIRRYYEDDTYVPEYTIFDPYDYSKGGKYIIKITQPPLMNNENLVCYLTEERDPIVGLFITEIEFLVIFGMSIRNKFKDLIFRSRKARIEKREESKKKEERMLKEEQRRNENFKAILAQQKRYPIPQPKIISQEEITLYSIGLDLTNRCIRGEI